MKQKKAKGTGKSPYKKYQKVPYQYQYKKCEHKNSVIQSVPSGFPGVAAWKGKVCCVCNIITDGPYQ